MKDALLRPANRNAASNISMLLPVRKRMMARLMGAKPDRITFLLP